MSGPSKVIVLDPDPRAGRQLQLGFEREGVSATVAQVGGELGQLAIHADDAGLIVVGGHGARGLELLAKTRAHLADGGHDLPIVFAGRGVRRSEAELAGADEVLLAPTHLRDVVTIGRMLGGLPAKHRAHIVGSLAETTGVYTLVRALAAVGRSAVLTLLRGLRRGEVRFYHGEVTSAQVGMTHGQAALHQLLLWTDARFDYRHEDVVRRQQIPLTHEELFADADQFLMGVRESAGELSPAMVLAQDVPRVQALGKQIPTEVHGVLRMFDGHRILADVLEDSPYRVFETLRVAQRAMEAGLLKLAPTPRPKATWRAVLAIEEWLVGSETRDGVVERTASMLDSQPVDPRAAADSPRSQGASPASSAPKSRKKRGKKKGPANASLPASSPGVGGGKQEIDWGALVPRIVGAEVGPLAGVVPAMTESGEIVSRREARERLEAVTDTAMRSKIFPADLAAEPSVVWNEADERAAIATEAAAKNAAAVKAAADAKAIAEAESKAELAAKQARIKELVEKQRREREDMAAAEAAAQATKAKADADAAAAVAAAAKATADAEAVAAAAKATAEAVAAAAMVKANADAVARAAAEVLAQAKADGDAKAKANAEAAAVAANTRAAADAAAQARSDADAASKATAAAEAARAAALAPRVTGDARPQQERPSARELVEQLLAKGRETGGLSHRVHLTDPVTLIETAASTVVATDKLTVVAHDDMAVLTSTPQITVTETAAAPDALVDESSDGVIHAAFTAPETAPLARARRVSAPPAGKYPDPQPEQRGEIPSRTSAASEPGASTVDQPSVLVADLAAAQHAIAAVTAAQARAPATPDATTKVHDKVVAEVRKDAAVAFTDAEEAFFRGGDDKAAPVVRAQPVVESFEDLDADYKPVGFWDRVRGRNRHHSITSDPPLTSREPAARPAPTPTKPTKK